MSEHETDPQSSQPETETQPESGMGQDISATVAKLGAGEKLAVLGAAAVLAVWLVFDLLIDEYSIGTMSFVLSLAIVYAAYRHHNRGSEGWAIPYQSVVWAAAAVLGVLGVWFLIEEIRGDILDADAATVIGGLAFYVAAIVSGVGAYQLSSTR